MCGSQTSSLEDPRWRINYDSCPATRVQSIGADILVSFWFVDSRSADSTSLINAPLLLKGNIIEASAKAIVKQELASV